MKEFTTKTEYTMPTVADGIMTGKLLARIHNPIKDKTGQTMTILVEHFIINIIEVQPINPGDQISFARQEIMLRSQNLVYKMEEFTKIIADNNIFIPLDETGIPGLESKVSDIIMEQLVRSGGSKNNGTYAVPGNDWELAVK